MGIREAARLQNYERSAALDERIESGRVAIGAVGEGLLQRPILGSTRPRDGCRHESR